MKFVALVSGGKDSCYNILHCLKNGHELVALANLYPIDKNVQELDSFMFQTVGHDIVSFYGKCTGLPLFRRPIMFKSSKNVSLNYFPTEGDEIEDLFQLLSDVQKENPDIKGVSVGTILSSYQRTRVEDVCSRLGLIVLSYLWQRDQLQLMQEMCQMSKSDSENSTLNDSRLDARLIKVAAIGLTQNQLGKSLPQVFPLLQKLNNLYQVHICGEGGEFETIVLDAPFFTKGKLDIISSNVLDPYAADGVYNLNLDVNFVERELVQIATNNLDKLPTPPLLDEKWIDLQLDLQHIDVEPIKNIQNEINIYNQEVTINKIGDILYISNILPSSGSDIKSKTIDVLDQLDNILKKRSLYSSQILFCSLILADMNDFLEVNEVYKKFFDVSKVGPLPPSRMCVESCFLSKDISLQLSVTVDISSSVKNISNIMLNENKDGLHVQGISYWCPCNIGPYSQVIWRKNDVNKVSYISGQIPLIPNTMEMPKLHEQKPNILQSILSLRHFDMLKKTIGAVYQLSTVCFVSELTMIPIVAKTWYLYCSKMSNRVNILSNERHNDLKTLVIVKVSRLPRDALCEWGGIVCNEIKNDDYDECDEDLSSQYFDQATLKTQYNIDNSHTNYSVISNTHIKRCFVTVFVDLYEELVDLLHKYKNCQITLYYAPTTITKMLHLGNVEYFPVEAVYDETGKFRNFGLQIKF